MLNEQPLPVTNEKQRLASIAVHGSSVAPDLPTQLDFMAAEGIGLLELSSVDQVPTAELDAEDIDLIGRTCEEAGVRVFSLRTTVGLSAAPTEEDRKVLARCVRFARRLGAEHVVIQSYWRAIESGGRDRFSVISGHFQRLLLGEVLENIVLCVRNVAGTTCETSIDLLRLVDSVGSPHLRAVFDPANAALVGEVAYSDGFPLLVPHLAYLHGRDFDPGAGIFVPPGEGVCQWTEMLAHLKQSGLNVPVCLDLSRTHVGDDARAGSIARAHVGAVALAGLMRKVSGPI